MENKINENLQFLSAKGFHETGIELAKKINPNIGNKSFEIAPISAVNLSFSAELLLKLIYLLEIKETIREHKLDVIYNLLPNIIKIEIKEKYEEYKKKSEVKIYPFKLAFNTEIDDERNQIDKFDIDNLTLENLLKVHSDGFIKWRYAYEIKQMYYSFEFNPQLMDAFIKSLIYIIETKYSQKLQIT